MFSSFLSKMQQESPDFEDCHLQLQTLMEESLFLSKGDFHFHQHLGKIKKQASQYNHYGFERERGAESAFRTTPRHVFAVQSHLCLQIGFLLTHS